MESNSTSADHVLAKCGGALVVARWLGLNASAVYKWTYPSERSGTGGTIPAKWHQPLLDHARKEGIGLEPSDFFRPARDTKRREAAA